MSKIVNLQECKRIVNKEIVLCGGCFDILHTGHINFLAEAKKLGDLLVVLLESDKNVRRLKEKGRPVFSQKERAEVLSSIRSVDMIVLLPPMKTDEEYEKVVSLFKPKIIAVTCGDPLLSKKKIQAEKVKGKVKILPFIKKLSSSKLILL
jgi:rfaE bifunctional protein nucleotidyltransferase chain/domain